jgi:hypothetical protein
MLLEYPQDKSISNLFRSQTCRGGMFLHPAFPVTKELLKIQQANYQKPVHLSVYYLPPGDTAKDQIREPT